MKRIARQNILVALFLLISLEGIGSDPILKKYQQTLDKWTRNARQFSVDNLELRMQWHATYFSPEFRQARRERLAHRQEWSPEEIQQATKKDEADQKLYDDFFIDIYAGSNVWNKIGTDTTRWRLFLETEGVRVKSLGFQLIPVFEEERGLYPYLDKWSKAYLIRFPKITKEGKPFTLKMAGVPGRSVLEWK